MISVLKLNKKFFAKLILAKSKKITNIRAKLLLAKSKKSQIFVLYFQEYCVKSVHLLHPSLRASRT
jgi:hypothetical protein